MPNTMEQTTPSFISPASLKAIVLHTPGERLPFNSAHRSDNRRDCFFCRRSCADGTAGRRVGAGIPANPKELKGGSANDGVPSLSLISIFGFLSVNPSSVAAMPAICLLPYIAIGDRGEARTVTTHCSRTMRSLRRHMGGKVIVVVSATAFFGRTCKHCCRGQHGYHD